MSRLSYYTKGVKATLAKLSALKKSRGDAMIPLMLNYAWCRLRHGYAWQDYVVSRPDLLSEKGRRRTVTAMRYNRLLAKYNDPSYCHLMLDKIDFLNYFKDFAKREYFDPRTQSIEELRAFMSKHPVALAKARADTLGRGIYLVKSTDNLDETYTKLKRDNGYIEELIEQHPALAEVCRSVNTLRIHTIMDGKGAVHILKPFIRFGKGQSIVDNLHAGGLMYPVDLKTGIISEAGFDADFKRSVLHPGTDKTLIGLRIPFWPECLGIVENAAKTIPQIRIIGWDVAVTANGPVLVEGNHDANYQMFENIGEPRFNYPTLKAWL